MALLLAVLTACGGAVRQSPECAKWIACADALPGAVKGTQDVAYGPDGNCWKAASADTPAQCSATCRDATAAQAMMANAPEACR